MRKFALLALLPILGACTTAQLQNTAQRLAYINQIACSAGATMQPIIVNLGSAVAVVADPADTAKINAAVQADAAIHAQLQAACPAGTQFLNAVAAGASATPAKAS